MYMITRETIYFINLRQAYLVSPLYANRVSSRTVLFSAIPDEYLDEAILRQLLGEDVVLNVWIPRHVAKLINLVDERDSVAMKLENAEIQLIKNVNKAWRKQIKETLQSHGEELSSLNTGRFSRRESKTSTLLEAEYLEAKHRPSHRVEFLVGKKVDTIDWCRSELVRLIPEVELMQQNHQLGKGKPHNSAFVEFRSLRDAQSAFQSLTHHQASRMSPRYTGIVPEEVIWTNLRVKWWERAIRRVLSTVLIVAIIALLAVPSAFIQGISNAQTLASTPALHWLMFLNNLPSWLSGLVTGMLPTLLLLIISALVVPILRCKSKFQAFRRRLYLICRQCCINLAVIQPSRRRSIPCRSRSSGTRLSTSSL